MRMEFRTLRRGLSRARALTRSPTSRRSRLASIAGIVGLASAALVGAVPTFWTVSTQSEFLKGDVEDLSVDSDGRMFLGPSTSLVAETAAPFLWAVATGADGTLWAGTGNEGKVLKIGKDGKVATFFDATELEVHAIVPAPNNGLYVATSPDGKIYQVNADGSSRTFFDPEDKYIWALALDRAGNLFAATGDKGVIYKITPDGKGTRFYKTSSTNVVSLAFSPSGDLLAGTESPGRVFRIDASGKAFVLLDSPYKEIHALRLADDGTLYAAAVSGSTAVIEDRSLLPTTTDSGRAPVPTVSTEITAISVVDAGSTASAGTPVISGASRRSNRGAVYRIRPNGLWDTYWETGEDSPYDLLVEPSGSLLVGTGPEGKIFRVTGDPARPTLLSRAAARQITALMREPSGRVLGATSNPGKIFALSANPAAKGSYESDVRDAGTVATWGVIRWRAAAKPGQIQLLSRSGNTATPDETWSAWSKPYSNAEGEQIASPNARYLQWRATLTGDSASPILTSVTAAYLPRNLRPEVATITVHPPGVVFQRPFSGSEIEIAGFEDNTSDGKTPAQSQTGPGGTPPPPPPLGRRIYQKGLQTFVWKAEDANGDRLQYRRFVQARRRHGVEGVEARDLGRDLRLGYDLSSRWHLRRPRDSVGCAGECSVDGARRRSREREFRYRQHLAADRDPAGHANRHAFDHQLRGAGRSVRRSEGRVLSRCQPLANGLSEGWHPGLEARGFRSRCRRQRGRQERHHPCDRRHEQRRHGRCDVAALRRRLRI